MPSRRRLISSWAGLEQYREQLRALAHEVVQTDSQVQLKAVSQGWEGAATGLICAAIRDPSTAPTPEVARAAAAQLALREIQRVLTFEHGLDWYFVRKEWATILDPRPEESNLCESLITASAAKETRETLEIHVI